MKTAIEQSVKAKIKTLAEDRGDSFLGIWRNMILERFLVRLAASPYKEKFILKGGALLAKYIPIGRETEDLDFFLQRLSNTEHSLKAVLQAIGEIDTGDSFVFEVIEIKVMDHGEQAYAGAAVTLLANFGATKTIVHMDLGFSDHVEPIEYPIELIATSKGPLFESSISLRCYSKEFIFAEKLQTTVSRGGNNSRMKDFHDLYSMVCLGVLDDSLAGQAIRLVFEHRKTVLTELPIVFDEQELDSLEQKWSSYRNKVKARKNGFLPPESIEDIVSVLNQGLSKFMAADCAAR